MPKRKEWDMLRKGQRHDYRVGAVEVVGSDGQGQMRNDCDGRN